MHENIQAVIKTNKGNTDTFIETETGSGDGVRCATTNGFKKILSCDVNREVAAVASKIFAKQEGVSVYHFRSISFLEQIQDVYNTAACFFWLSGSGGGRTPIIDELNIIAKSKIKTHTILIDGVDEKTVKLKPVVDLLRKINPKYEMFRYNTTTPGRLLLARIKEKA